MTSKFQKQLTTTGVIVLVFSILNTVLKHWIFSSIGFCICGLIWIIHPVKMNDIRPEKSQFVECRIAGVIIFLLGIMLRARLY